MHQPAIKLERSQKYASLSVKSYGTGGLYNLDTHVHLKTGCMMTNGHAAEYVAHVGQIFICRKVKDHHQQIQGRNLIGRSSIRTSCGICAIHRHCQQKSRVGCFHSGCDMTNAAGLPSLIFCQPIQHQLSVPTTRKLLIHAVVHYICVVLHGNVWKCMMYMCMYAFMHVYEN